MGNLNERLQKLPFVKKFGAGLVAMLMFTFALCAAIVIYMYSIGKLAAFAVLLMVAGAVIGGPVIGIYGETARFLKKLGVGFALVGLLLLLPNLIN